MVIDFDTYKLKLRSCFTGKAVGGTLGMPMEGYIGVKKISYYDPVPTAMVANDDLDAQVIWAETVRDCGLPVNRRDLADGWARHMRGLPDEYGVVMRNLSCGLYPPLSGAYDNSFTAGMGAAIRSEIWAALAPGDPSLAAALASEDACCDHYGDGVDAERFLAALESLAYAESDIDRLIRTALTFIHRGGRLDVMLRDAVRLYGELGDPAAVRAALLKKYFVQNWTDVGIDLSYILIGLLDGEKESEPERKITRALCSAVGLGHDADCTGATLGSILGILYPMKFEKRWTDPIGGDLVLSSCIPAMHEEKTIDGFCGLLAGMCADVLDYYRSPVKLSDIPEHKPLARYLPDASRVSVGGDYSPRESLVALRPYILRLTYPENVAQAPGVTVAYKASVSQASGKALTGRVKLTVSSGWKVKPDEFVLGGDVCEFEFSVTAPSDRARRVSRSELYFDFSADGFSFRLDAGLAETYPLLHIHRSWTGGGCPPDALFAEAAAENVPGHRFAIPDGGQIYRFDVRAPYIVTEAIMLAQSTRPVRVWQDGRLILSHDGTEFCPAFHRTENIARLSLNGDWSRFVVAVAADSDFSVSRTPYNAYARVPGCPTPYEQRRLYDVNVGRLEPGELFIGFAERREYRWIDELEWKYPGK